MGQSESREENSLAHTPPEAANVRRDYLQNLGFSQNKQIALPDRGSRNAPPSFPSSQAGPSTSLDGNSHEKGARERTSSDGNSAEKGTSQYSNPDDRSSKKESKFEMNFLDLQQLKEQQDFRVAFLRKLSYEKVWVPQAQRPPQHQTVVIFDWDDTLLPTSFLQQSQDQAPARKKFLESIQSIGKQILELALQMGHTFIITNAMEGWVEYSAAKYMPQLLPVLQRIHVISARNYEQQYPGNYSQWKIQAFLGVQRTLDSQIITNLISIGDSNFEMDAVHVMGQEFEQALVKTIKFKANPTDEELHKQLELVALDRKSVV